MHSVRRALPAKAHPTHIQEHPEAEHSKTDPLDGDLFYLSFSQNSIKALALLPQRMVIFMQHNVLFETKW